MEYAPNQLNRRKEIIESQQLFWSFLDSTMMNKLVNLFDDTVFGHDKISNYVENERILRGMDDAKVISKIIGEKTRNPSLLLELKKKEHVFLHITFHLSPHTLNPIKTGAIHMFKNIYKKTNVNNGKGNIYALIHVKKPVGKPNSLEFRIADGYKTPGINADEKELQEEMDVIIYVVNRLFNENDPYYIGVKEEIININPRINTILHNINRRNVVQLKNKGVRMIRKINKNIPAVPVFYNKYHKTPKGRARSPKARNVTKKIVPANKPKID
jgi:hypothetical protein